MILNQNESIPIRRLRTSTVIKLQKEEEEELIDGQKI